MRLVIEVSDDFHHTIKGYAENHGVSLKALVVAALTAQMGVSARCPGSGGSCSFYGV